MRGTNTGVASHHISEDLSKQDLVRNFSAHELLTSNGTAGIVAAMAEKPIAYMSPNHLVGLELGAIVRPRYKVSATTINTRI